jgi:hypothetical protein
MRRSFSEFTELPVPALFQTMNTAYRANARGTDPGEVKWDVINDHHVRLTVRVPFPDDEWYGVCYGYMRRFAPPGTQFTIYYDDAIPRCDLGGEVTVIHVEWR